MIRKALEADIPAVAAIYDKLHTEEEAGRATIGWIRGVYPTEDTARMALDRDDLFVQEEGGHIVGAAIINQTQVDAYEGGQWTLAAEVNEVMVLHTLVIDPDTAGRGFGKQFVAFYEDYAREKGCKVLRMDTNSRNTRARAMYQALGYREAGIVPCVFNGIEGVELVLLEKPAGSWLPPLGGAVTALAVTEGVPDQRSGNPTVTAGRIHLPYAGR